MKTVNPQQKAAREERRARFRALWKEIAAMPDEARIARSDRLGIVTADGRALSPRNTCLVAMQIPNASVVGGFRQWLKQGRCVKKGQHGAMIWVPIGRKSTNEPTHGDAEIVLPGETNGETDTRFIIGWVFDITQTEEKTEAPAIPESGPIDLGNFVFAPDASAVAPAALAVPASRPSWRRAA